MATEWKEEEAEIAGEFDGGCGLETKRRRDLSVRKENKEMEDEAADAAVAGESGSVFFDEEEGTEIFSSDGAEKKLENGKPEVRYKLEHLQIIPVEKGNQDPKSVEVGNKLNSQNAESITVTQPDTQTLGNNGIAKIAKHVADLDLEKVLEEQETHDLFCPNCHSCITKRVILRKRKRKLQGVQHEERPEKLRQVESNTVDIQETSYDNEPDIFKCLSCFSFFIPTENGFNIFRIFRKREENVSRHNPNEQHPGQVSSREGNGFSSIIKAEYEAEAATQLPVKFKISSSGDQLPIEIKGTPAQSTSEAAKVGESHATIGKIDSASTQFPVELKVSSGWDQLTMGIKGAHSLSTSESANVGERHAINGKIISEVDSITPVVTVEPSFSKPTSHEDTSICISAPATTVLLPQGDVQIHLGNQISLEPLRGNEWEVMKSIIYGGLIESITSLGVVSSAAGAQTLTLNVVALGLANLIGGFFVILHDLSELKSSVAPNQKDEQDSRYWKLLGRKSNFSLHATVCIVSYILFGLLPPVIYGFSFRKSDDKDYKMIAVAAASLLCIALLAVGKAHVSEPKSYIKTFVYYIGLGFTASGLSYVAGMMINRFLEQLGLFEHNAPVPSPPSVELFGVNSLLASWASE